MKKSSALDRFRKGRPDLTERRFGLPDIGTREDGEKFNPTVQAIADAIAFYGFGVRDADIVERPDTDLSTGNPISFKPFPPAIQTMQKYLEKGDMYRYPYTEGDDIVRKQLLDYLEREGCINTEPYSYKDVDEKGFAVHNVTFSTSTSEIFNQVITSITRPGDVVLVTAPNYGLFTIRAERAGGEVELFNLEKEDGFMINPSKLAKRIDELNESLQIVYHNRKGYVPRVVGFLHENPNNPLGTVMGKKQYETLCEIAEVCKQRGVFIIDDLVYRDITYDPENVALPIATIPGMFQNCISLFGLSKSYGMAALRAGLICAPEEIIRDIVNQIFQQKDSPPAITGEALAGAFNGSDERYEAAEEYFSELREKYLYQYNLLKSLVSGIETVEERFSEKVKEEITNTLGKVAAEQVLKGLPMVHFPENLEPQAGFFAILDFTELKGMKYKGVAIRTEEDLVKFFYDTYRIRFLAGQSISWPYKDELVGRITFSLDSQKLILALSCIHTAIYMLEWLYYPKEYLLKLKVIIFKIYQRSSLSRLPFFKWK